MWKITIWISWIHKVIIIQAQISRKCLRHFFWCFYTQCYYEHYVAVCCSFLAIPLHLKWESRDAKVASHRHSIQSSWNCVEWCSTAGHSQNRCTLFSHCYCACAISSMVRLMLSLNQCCSGILSHHCQVRWASMTDICDIYIYSFCQEFITCQHLQEFYLSWSCRR